jgi:SAM domain (Sterile alpha motif)
MKKGGAATKTRPLVSLSEDEVCSLLAKIDLGRYKEVVIHWGIDGSALAAAEHADDLTEIGMSLLHSRRLLEKVITWRTEGVPPTDLIVAKAVNRVSDMNHLNECASKMEAQLICPYTQFKSSKQPI